MASSVITAYTNWLDIKRSRIISVIVLFRGQSLAVNENYFPVQFRQLSSSKCFANSAVRLNAKTPIGHLFTYGGDRNWFHVATVS